ncbi:MAG: hypothetical protein ABIG95_05975 [Candidatus Woesearchaeota archaeon]
MTLFIYLFLCWLEQIKIDSLEIELILFSTLFVFWLSFVLFKNHFLIHGLNLIKQNIPNALQYLYFKDFNILEAIYKIGIIPFIMGIFAVYQHILVEKNRKIYLLVAFAFAIFFLIWLKLINLDIGLIYLSIILTVLSAQSFKAIATYLNKTKFTNKIWFTIGFSALILVTSVIPTVYYAHRTVAGGFNEQEIMAFEWLKLNTPENSVVLATVEEGNLVTAISQRKNVADSNFILQHDADQRIKDIGTVYTTIFETEALRILDKYYVNYILFSKRAQDDYDITKILYSSDTKCFELVYDSQTTIYQVKCKIEEVQ